MKRFQPINIFGFRFTCKSKNYIIKSFTIKSNTRVVKDKKRERFLQLIYRGELELYRDAKSTLNDVAPAGIVYNKNQILTYYDLYLYDNSKGLTKVEISSDTKTINQLLDKYDLDKEYIKKIPSNTKLKNIDIILKNYDLWINNNEKI